MTSCIFLCQTQHLGVVRLSGPPLLLRNRELLLAANVSSLASFFLFLLPTGNVETQTVSNNDNIEFNVIDFPGNYMLKSDSVQHIANCGALIYVIDAHYADYESACQKLFEVIQKTSQIKPDIWYEVFIHKVDSDMFMNDDQKIECLNAIQTNMRGLLQEFR